MELSTTWSHYFKNLESLEETNKRMSVLSSASLYSEETDKIEAIRAFTEDEDLMIMVIAQVTNKVKILHSLKNLGGTRRKPTNKIVALDGFAEQAIPIMLSDESIAKKLTVRTPSLTRLRTFVTKQQISESTIITTGQQNFKSYPFAILPPFLALDIIDTEDREPESLFIQCQESIDKFDSEHENDASYESAKENCKHILSFLWAASKNLIDPIETVSATDDVETKRWCDIRHESYLLTAGNRLNNDPNNNQVSNEMLQSLSNSIQHQTDLFETFQREKQEDKDDKKNKYTDLHDSSQQLILNASSADGITAPEEPTAQCIEFFKKKNISKAMDFLTTTLSQDLRCCVDIGSGLVTALFSGHFIRDREDSPSNFSFFLTPKKQPMTTDRLKSTMILQLKASQGKGWSYTDLKDALKQGIVTPNDMPTFNHQLKNFWGLTVFFFGQECILAKRLAPMMATISNHTLTFESAQFRDNTFATKLGYAVDTRVFRWLEQCRTFTDRGQVNDRLLDFNIIVDQILTDSFFQVLPLTFKKFVAPDAGDSETMITTDSNMLHRNKRTRSDTPRQDKRIMNPKPIKSWQVSPVDFNKYMSTKNLELRVPFPGKFVCPRFHSKGYCFDDCANKLSHIPSTDLDDNVQKSY